MFNNILRLNIGCMFGNVAQHNQLLEGSDEEIERKKIALKEKNIKN